MKTVQLIVRCGFALSIWATFIIGYATMFMPVLLRCVVPSFVAIAVSFVLVLAADLVERLRG
jgi:hypothetical protein